MVSPSLTPSPSSLSSAVFSKNAAPPSLPLCAFLLLTIFLLLPFSLRSCLPRSRSLPYQSFGAAEALRLTTLARMRYAQGLVLMGRAESALRCGCAKSALRLGCGASMQHCCASDAGSTLSARLRDIPAQHCGMAETSPAAKRALRAAQTVIENAWESAREWKDGPTRA